MKLGRKKVSWKAKIHTSYDFVPGRYSSRKNRFDAQEDWIEC